MCAEFKDDATTMAAFTRVIARLAEDKVFRIRKGCAYPIAMMAQVSSLLRGLDSPMLPPSIM